MTPPSSRAQRGAVRDPSARCGGPWLRSGRRRGCSSRCCWHLAALAVEPSEMLKDPALEARARDIGRGAALRGLPEPVDRRFRRRGGARHAPRRARAADRRRQRRRGLRLHGGALRRLRAAEAAVQAGHAGAVAGRARWSCWSPAAPCCSAARRRARRAPAHADRRCSERGALLTAPRAAARMSEREPSSARSSRCSNSSSPSSPPPRSARCWSRCCAPRVAATDRLDNDLAVYRDQLAEVERERAAGTLSDADAAAARTEIERRLLAAAERDARWGRATAMRALAPLPHRPRSACVIPLFALGLYLAHRPSRPARRRRSSPAPPRIARRRAARTHRRGASPPRAPGSPPAPDDPDALSALGEALTDEADGVVTPPAQAPSAGAGQEPRRSARDVLSRPARGAERRQRRPR